MNHSAERSGLLEGVGPARCPRCRERLGFGTDSNGCAIERCDCGYRAFVHVRVVGDVVVKQLPPV